MATGALADSFQEGELGRWGHTCGSNPTSALHGCQTSASGFTCSMPQFLHSYVRANTITHLLWAAVGSMPVAHGQHAWHSRLQSCRLVAFPHHGHFAVYILQWKH